MKVQGSGFYEGYSKGHYNKSLVQGPQELDQGIDVYYTICTSGNQNRILGYIIL